MTRCSLAAIPFAILLSLPPTADAQVERVFVRQVDNGGMGDLARTVTNDVSIDFQGELRLQRLLVDLTKGQIY